MVAIRSRLFASDEELGKRDDDHKPKALGLLNVRHRPRWRKRRIAGYLLGCLLLGLFVYNIPTDLGRKDQRRPHYGSSEKSSPRAGRAIPKSEYSNEDRLAHEALPDPAVVEPRANGEAAVGTDHEYDGPVRFYALAGSLHGIANIVDFRSGNRHVLFAASDLSSAAAIIPLACEMANWKRNNVHFAIMARDEISIEEIMRINGATFKDCPIYWHDARPDSASISTEARMQLSVAGAFGHVNSFMQPQALITADSDHENVYFVMGTSRAAKSLGWTHIEIPKTDPEKLGWLSRLDASSLHSWHSATFDILVQAPLESSGSLIRLLMSLESADYTGFMPPRLTIELPHKIDLATQNFLTRFRWPPRRYLQGQGQDNQFIVRRRISEQQVAPEEASRRFIESFYPSSPRGPHVLLLSPQVELSPTYYHYLKLHILEYKNSYDRPLSYRSMFGISLETPSTYLNASAEFPIPRNEDEDENDDNDDDYSFEPFRWQAPNANAALYFSDKWIELHSFLTKRRTASLHPRTKKYHARRPKMVSEKLPSWMEYVLDLMRMRGYWLHYPGLFYQEESQSAKADSRSSSLANEEALVIVHNELYQPPEVLRPRQVASDSKVARPPPPAETVLSISAEYLATHHPVDGPSSYLNDERPLLRKINPLLKPLLLPHNPNPDVVDIDKKPLNPPFPELEETPLIDSEGEEMDIEEMEAAAAVLAKSYRRSAGGCSEEESVGGSVQPGSAEDLFCSDNDVDDEAGEEEDDEDAGRAPENADDEDDARVARPGRTSSNSKARKRPQKEIKRLHGAEARAAGAAAIAIAKVASDPTPTRIFGSDGVAATIDRVVNAEHYEETARAGFLKQLANTAQRQKEQEARKKAAFEAAMEDARRQDEESAPLQDSEDHRLIGTPPPNRENMQATSDDNENDDEFFRLFGNAKEQQRVRQKQQKQTNDRKKAEAASPPALAGDVEGKESPVLRDAPPIEAVPKKPGQSFEDHMASRDAAKKDALNDRARANPGKILRAGESSDADFAPLKEGGGAQRARSGVVKGRAKAAGGDEDEVTGESVMEMPDMPPVGAGSGAAPRAGEEEDDDPDNEWDGVEDEED